MKKQGSISIFIALIILCILSLMFVLLESARTAGARWHLQNIVASAHDSLFSEYQKDLWENYRLSFLEYIDDEELCNTLKKYSESYIKNQSWYGLNSPEYKVEDKKFIHSDDAYYLEKEILDFMKYEIFDFSYLGDDIENFSTKLNDAKAVKSIGTSYEKEAKKAGEVENQLEDLVVEISNAKSAYEDAYRYIEDEDLDSFINKANELENSIENAKGLFDNYNESQNKLIEDIKEVDTKHIKEWEELSEDIYSGLRSKTDNYKEYANASEVRNNNISSMVSELESSNDYIKSSIDLAVDLSKEDDIDVSELKEIWENIQISSLESDYGIADKEKEKSIKELSKLLDGSLLELVLPRDMQLSEGEITINNLPSELLNSNKKYMDINYLDKLLTGEYLGRYFGNALDNSDKELKYEMEYILIGNKSDESNLSGAVMRIIGIREGLNILHILSDQSKMAQAQELALAIMGVLCLPQLVFLMEFLIIGLWALAEAILDVRALLAGGKVALYKIKNEWQLNIENLLDFSEYSSNRKEDKFGLDYEKYIKILLYIESWQNEKYRILDIIQNNFYAQNIDIEVKNLLYGIETEAYSKSRRIFNNIIRIDGDNIGNSFSLRQKIIKTY